MAQEIIRQIALKLERLANGKGLEFPTYETAGAAGMDIASAEYVEIAPQRHAVISTGFGIEIPDGYEVQVRPRSGLAAKYGITVLNAPGTIDCDFRGEIKVILMNHGTEPFAITRDDRIAQLVIAPYYTARIEEVDKLDETARGDAGFGSTGISSEVDEA